MVIIKYKYFKYFSKEYLEKTVQLCTYIKIVRTMRFKDCILLKRDNPQILSYVFSLQPLFSAVLALSFVRSYISPCFQHIST